MSVRNQIISAARLPEETVDMPEWGVTVLVRGLSAKDQAAVFRRSRTQEGDVDAERLTYEIIIATVCDVDGNRIFDPADRDTLATMPARPIRRLQEVCYRLSGLTDEAKVVRDLDETGDADG